MMRRLIVTLLMFVCLRFGLRAQDGPTITMSMAKYDRMEAQRDSLKFIIGQMQSFNDSLSVSLVAKDSIISNLRRQLTIVSAQMSKDSIELADLRDTILIQKVEIARLNEKVASLDMVRLRYANGRLQLPYDDKKVEEAIKLFNSITDEALKEECKDILFWLNHYSYYLRDVRRLMHTLQDDSRRTDKFMFEEWKSDALSTINENAYLRESDDHYFTIIYLDNIISAAKSRIERAGDKPSVDFSDLLERF